MRRKGIKSSSRGTKSGGAIIEARTTTRTPMTAQATTIPKNKTPPKAGSSLDRLAKAKVTAVDETLPPSRAVIRRLLTNPLVSPLAV